MTPKEEAQDLINKFHQFIPLTYKGMGYPENAIKYKIFNAKESALICAEKIRDELRGIIGAYKYMQPNETASQNEEQREAYWDEVIEEIKKHNT